MEKFDFDIPVERRGTGCMKWDECQGADIIPLWVADMDFRTAPVVIEALSQRVNHGVFGYTYPDDGYFNSLTEWFARRHGWNPDRGNVIYTSGVVPALSAIIKGLARPGDGVIVQTPVYNCFFSSIRNNGCRVVENPLVREDCGNGQFSFSVDYDDLREKVMLPETKLLLLCNPHNPAGRVWSRSELEKICAICREGGVRVISDEIHCELCMPGYRYTPYALVDSQAVICVSPSKAFNTAGLQIANIVCPDQDVRVRVDRAINDNEVCDVNPFGIVGLKAAYTSRGEEWLSQLISYLHGNYKMVCDMIDRRFDITKLEGTYLPMIDVRSLGIPVVDLERQLLDEARVWVNSSSMYGCEGYLRINIATRRELLGEGVRRIIEFLKP